MQQVNVPPKNQSQDQLSLWSENTETENPDRVEYDIGREERGHSRTELARSQFQTLFHADDACVADVTAILESDLAY